MAVIGGQIAEGVLHPATAEVLAIADTAVPLIAFLIVFITIVRGKPDTVERVFRLLRWITNRPEPAEPPKPTNAEPAPKPPNFAAGNLPYAAADLVIPQAAASEVNQPRPAGVSS